jgi:hypothetical protein
MFDDSISCVGNVKIKVLDQDGKVKEERDLKNLVVSTGLNYICSRMKDATATAMSHMAIGTGTTAAAAGDTALGTQLDIQTTTTTVSTNTIEYVASFGTGLTGAVTESGIFNASSSGTMLCRVVFSAVNLSSTDTLQVTWTLTISAS